MIEDSRKLFARIKTYLEEMRSDRNEYVPDRNEKYVDDGNGNVYPLGETYAESFDIALGDLKAEYSPENIVYGKFSYYSFFERQINLEKWEQENRNFCREQVLTK